MRMRFQDHRYQPSLVPGALSMMITVCPRDADQ